MTVSSVGRLVIVAFLLAPAALQARQASGPSFQFVSIRRLPPAPCPPLEICLGAWAPSRDPSSLVVLPGGRLEARNQSIENLVRVAFGFEQIDPAAGVVAESKFSAERAERFDVTAVAENEWTAPPSGQKVPSELRGMLRRLLEERFKLKTHVEMKKIDVFALRLDDPDHGPGPGLRRSTNECLGPYSDTPAGDPKPKCPLRLDSTHIEAGDVAMTELGTMLHAADRERVDRLVVDQTGLQGRYDVALTIVVPGKKGVAPPDLKDSVYSTSSPVNVERRRGPSPDLDWRRSLLRDAMQKQWRLRLVGAKLRVSTLIIDHAEAPIEN